MRSNQKVWQRLIHMLAIGAFLAVFSQPASPKIATAQNAPELTWTPMKPMLSGRAYFTATQLPSGKVLVVGGQASHFAEIYDPQKNIWEATSKPNITDFGYLQHHTATLLNDGRVLVTGGVIGSREIGNAMIYDPPENKWTSVRAMDRARSGHTATLLSDGRVLVYGGRAQNIFNIGMEIFSPSTNTWSPIPSLQRLFTANHTATPLKIIPFS